MEVTRGWPHWQAVGDSCAGEETSQKEFVRFGSGHRRLGITMGGRMVILVLTLLFVLLQYALWAGRHNVFDLFFLQDQLTHLEHDNAQLRKRNNRLHAEVIDIKNRLSAIEGKARSELGLIKPGETLIRIIPE